MRRGRTGSSVVAIVVALCLGCPAVPAAAVASAPGLAISVPSNASLGTAGPGQAVSGVLGPVTVTTTGLIGSSAGWTAAVSATAFTTGGGSAAETIPRSAITYWSGPATSLSGLSLSACTPGQPTAVQAQDLSSARTAYACTGVSLLAGTSLTWRPTVAVNPGPSAIAGRYQAVITHSVA